MLEEGVKMFLKVNDKLFRQYFSGFAEYKQVGPNPKEVSGQKMREGREMVSEFNEGRICFPSIHVCFHLVSVGSRD